MPKIPRAPFVEEPDAPHPVLGSGVGPYAHRILGDPGGLTQFGVHIERLPPGSRSSFRHWHETEDELVYMLSGEAVLHEDGGETILGAGDAAAWPAGSGNGHCLENRGTADAVYLVVGTRNARDVVHYPDDDLVLYKDHGARRYTRADGTPIETGETR